MTPKAKQFLAANRRSPVVYGSVIACPRRKQENGAPLAVGCYYRLDDGSTFRLNRRDLLFVPMPRWSHHD